MLSSTSAISAAIRAQNRVEQQRNQLAENQARLAFQHHQYVTRNTGSFLPGYKGASGSPVTFDTVFVEQPVVSTGVTILIAPDLTNYLLPQVTAGIFRWITTPSPGDAGKSPGDPTLAPLYTGAYCFFRVTCDPIAAGQAGGATCVLSHDLLFQGDAYKTLDPVNVTPFLTPSLPTRTVGYGQ